MADGLEWAAGVTPQEMADVILAYRNALAGAAGGDLDYRHCCSDVAGHGLCGRQECRSETA